MIRAVLLALVIVLGSAPGETAAHASGHPDGRTPTKVPRPCLVPPVPQKKGLPPRVGGPIRLDAATLDHQRAGTRALARGPDGAARLRVLVVRVDFEDVPMDSSTVYFERLSLFLKQHYEGISDGQLLLEPVVLPNVYRMPKEMGYYGLDDSIGVRQAILAYDAVQAADPDVDFGLFDRFLLFHAGPGQESDVKDDSREQIWSVFFRQLDFAFYLPYGNPTRGIVTADRREGGDTVFVESTAIFPETESQDGFVFSSVGVVCHEFGHALGLPDLYDTVALEDQIFAESQGVGSWDLMSSGTWNANGFVPGEFSAWSKVFLGWIEPRVVTSDQVVTLDAVEIDRRGGVVKIPISGDEYFLIENRQQDVNGDGRFNYDETDSTKCFYIPSGSDSTLFCLFDFYEDSYAGAEWDYWLPGESKGSGLLIWHIDQSVVDQNLEYNTVNAEPTQKGIDLEEADGIQDLDTPAMDILAFGSPYDSWRAGNADRFAPDTDPNTHAYFDIESGITIDQISASGPQMSFRVSFGGSTGAWPVLTAGPIGSNSVAVAELDGDTRREIAVADRLGNLYVLNDDGTPAWEPESGSIFKALGTSVGTPLLADVDGDDRDDLLVMADDGRVFGYKGGLGTPFGDNGLLLSVVRPPAGAELWAAELKSSQAGLEFAVPEVATDSTAQINFYSVTSGGVAVLLGGVELSGGSTVKPAVLLPGGSSSQAYLVASLRGGTPDARRGAVRVLSLTTTGTVTVIAEGAAALPDSFVYSAPVAGDLDRDGAMDVVVTGSDGLIRVFTPRAGAVDEVLLVPLPGWPRPVLASGNDAVSLADLDRNGYLEVLVQETGGVLHVLNYHGEPLVSLPEQVPSEIRYFIEPQLAPLVSDITADGRPEIVLPVRDGQVFAVGIDGERVSANYAGGGLHGSTPALEDLSGSGHIDLVTASNYLTGGRIDVHRLGRAGAPPAWPQYRRTGAHDGVLPTDTGAPVVNGPVLSDSFVMPNPARDSARIHYRVGAGVDEVSIEIVDMIGRGVRSFTGPAFAGTDNSVMWDLKGADGHPVAPGVYLARIETSGNGGSEIELLKFAVVK